MRFRDRAEAGRLLAGRLGAYAGDPGVIVLGLPRGGVEVAAQVASALGAALDVFVVRKLGVPGQPELAMGAIATGGVRLLNEAVLRAVGIGSDEIEPVARRETAELHRRELAYREGRLAPDLRGRIVVLVDDGIATGATMRAAARSVRAQAPARLVIAVPVAPATAPTEFAAEADEIVCLLMPEPLVAVGLWYDDFSQTTDEDVRRLIGSPAPSV